MYITCVIQKHLVSAAVRSRGESLVNTKVTLSGRLSIFSWLNYISISFGTDIDETPYR
jgi:hypothetical protein